MVLRESVGSGGTRPNWICCARFFSVGFEPRDFLLRHQREFGFRRFGFEQRAVFAELRGGLEKIFALRHQLLEPGVFARQFLRALRVVESLGVAQRGLDLGKAAAEFFDVRRQIHLIRFNHGWARIITGELTQFVSFAKSAYRVICANRG